MNHRRALSFVIASLVAAMIACFLGRASAEEKIVSFHAAIQVGTDGSIKVIERIEVHAEERRIRHGIFRDLPQIRSFGWMSLRLPFEVLSVTRNGKAEPFHVENTDQGIRIFAGTRDTLVHAGTHTYELRYRSRGQLGYFDDHDELHWNVTGHEWDFPVAQASAEVTLPDGVPSGAIQLRAYTGAPGSRAQHAQMGVTPSKTATFITTAPLAPGHTMTVVDGWPKGYVKKPSSAEQAVWLLEGWAQQWLGSVVSKTIVTATLLLLAFFLLSWLLFGRDPRKGTITPRSAPSQGITPAQAYVIDRMGWGTRAFTVTLVDFAVRGKLSLKELSPGKWMVQRTPPEPRVMDRATSRAFYADVSPAERTILDLLFGRSARVRLDSSGWKPLFAAMVRLQEVTEKATRHLYTAPQWPLFVLIGTGVLLFLAFILSINFSDRWTNLITWLFATLTLSLAGFRWWRAMRRRTVEGRKVMDELDGVRLGLKASVPSGGGGIQSTERLLPYAMALGEDRAWAHKLEREIATAMQAGRTQLTPSYGPNWLSSPYLGSSILALPHALSHTLDGAVKSSTHKAMSGSSGGGGGDSGGSGFSSDSGAGSGGGGGGGGGW